MPCSVPDLEFDFVAFERKRLEPEIDPNGGKKNLTELIISVSDNDRRLAYT
jgi:hypothetical protein